MAATLSHPRSSTTTTTTRMSWSMLLSMSCAMTLVLLQLSSLSLLTTPTTDTFFANAFSTTVDHTVTAATTATFGGSRRTRHDDHIQRLKHVRFDGKSTRRRSQLCAVRTKSDTTKSSSSSSSTKAAATVVKKNACSDVSFIVEELIGSKQPPSVFKDIAKMCITAFFNDNNNNNNKKNERFAVPNFCKEIQLRYLQMLQIADLERRYSSDEHNDVNKMFVARRAVPISNTDDDKAAYMTSPLILDTSTIYNLPKSSSSTSVSTNIFASFFQQTPSSSTSAVNDCDGDDDVEYVKGEIVGFVEITCRPYGINNSEPRQQQQQSDHDDDDKVDDIDDYTKRSSSCDSRKATASATPIRPVLTNLSVQKQYRSLGIGTILMDTCENSVRTDWWQTTSVLHDEIILEVEHDNDVAIQFYKARGYDVMVKNPACRKYDTNGVVLREIVCTRYILGKRLAVHGNAERPRNVFSLFSNGTN